MPWLVTLLLCLKQNNILCPLWGVWSFCYGQRILVQVIQCLAFTSVSFLLGWRLEHFLPVECFHWVSHEVMWLSRRFWDGQEISISISKHMARRCIFFPSPWLSKDILKLGLPQLAQLLHVSGSRANIYTGRACQTGLKVQLLPISCYIRCFCWHTRNFCWAKNWLVSFLDPKVSSHLKSIQFFMVCFRTGNSSEYEPHLH